MGRSNKWRVNSMGWFSNNNGESARRVNKFYRRRAEVDKLVDIRCRDFKSDADKWHLIELTVSQIAALNNKLETIELQIVQCGRTKDSDWPKILRSLQSEKHDIEKDIVRFAREIVSIKQMESK